MKFSDSSSQQLKRNRIIPDTRKIVHRHLQNMHDVITDEDIKSVRISIELHLKPDTGQQSQRGMYDEITSWNVIKS
jgi:hypothetical protein